MSYFNLVTDDNCFSISIDLTHIGNAEILQKSAPEHNIKFVNHKYFGGKSVLGHFSSKNSFTFTVSDVVDVKVVEETDTSIKVQFGLESRFGVDQFMLETYIHGANKFLTVQIDTISYTLIV